MMINAPNHTLTVRSFLPGGARDDTTGLLEWVLRRIHVALCGIHGHDSVLQYEGPRMFLRCTSCGHESPGWEVARGGLVMTRPEAKPARNLARGLKVVRKIA